jgi:hypothetical protein
VRFLRIGTYRSESFLLQLERGAYRWRHALELAASDRGHLSSTFYAPVEADLGRLEEAAGLEGRQRRRALERMAPAGRLVRAPEDVSAWLLAVARERLAVLRADLAEYFQPFDRQQGLLFTSTDEAAWRRALRHLWSDGGGPGGDRPAEEGGLPAEGLPGEASPAEPH